MKRYLFIVIFLLLCCGCKAHYNLKINDDLSFVENVSCTEKSNFFKKYNIDKEKNSDSIFLNYSNYLDNNSFIISNINNKNLYGKNIYKKYKNIDDFLNNSFYYKFYFQNLDIEESNDYITVSLTDLMKSPSTVTRLYIDNGVISITLPFEVVDSNADDVDIINNKYIWNFDLKNDKSIYLKFNKNKKVFRYDYLIIIGGGFLLLVILLIVFNIIKNKVRYRNSI